MSKKIIAVVNQKGGTGKTTTTINLGSALAKQKQKVLLIDLDPQANLSYALGITDAKPALADVFAGNTEVADVVVNVAGVDVLPGTVEMVDIELSLVNQPGREYYLKNILQDLPYDYILIDSPPSLSLLTLNALCAATELVVPLQPEVLTFRGLTQILGTISKIKSTLNPELKVKGILLVMYDKRKKLTLELEQYLHENVDENVFETVIRSNVKTAEAPSFGISVVDYDAQSNGAKDYLALAKEIIKADKKSTKSKKAEENKYVPSI